MSEQSQYEKEASEAADLATTRLRKASNLRDTDLINDHVPCYLSVSGWWS